MKTLKTTWEMRTYDVWGNARDGYEVNDSYDCGEIDLTLKMQTANAGTPHEFRYAFPSTAQIKRVFGTRCRIDVDGDDRVVYVNRRRDGYPIGELVLTSHDGLSPIK